MKPYRVKVGADFGRTFNSQVLKALGEQARRLSPPWHITPQIAEMSPEMLSFNSRNYDGILLMHNAKARRFCDDCHCPVLCTYEMPRGMPCIRHDHTAMGRQMAEYFLDLGYERFAFASRDADFSRERQTGFTQRLLAAGRHCDTLDQFTPELPTIFNDRVMGFRAWLRVLPKPIAVMGACDVDAHVIIDAAHAEGFDVPNDIAVAGVDNNECMCLMTTPTLTSLDRNAPLFGITAANALHRLMQGHCLPEEHMYIRDTPIVPRESTNAIGCDDPIVRAATQYIREHLADVSLADLVRHTGFATRTIQNRFTKTLRRTPQAEIRRQRHRAVKHRLLHTNDTLEQIAQAIGFTDASHLGNVFRAVEGVSPGVFRTRTTSFNI